MKKKRLSCIGFYYKILLIFAFVFPNACVAQLTTDMVSIINHGLSYNTKKKELIKEQIVNNADKIFESDSFYSEKNPIVVIFFDYSCGHCKLIDQRILSLHAQHPHVKIIYKEFPIRDKNSRFAAKSSIASRSQGGHERFHQALFQLHEITPYSVIEAAKKVNLNIPVLTREMESTETYQVISDNYALAKQLKLVGTPGFVIYSSDKDQKPHIYYIQGALNWQTLEELILGSK